MNGWLKKWGPWIGPTTLVAIIGFLNLWQVRGESPTGQTEYVRQTRAMVDVLKLNDQAQDRWIGEHQLVAVSRIAQLDAIDKLTAVQKEREDAFRHKVEEDINEIKGTLKDLSAAVARLERRGVRP